jgi:nucleotide-binding universal stress UspA family protein
VPAGATAHDIAEEQFGGAHEIFAEGGFSMIRHILAGFDGSESSRKAARFAHDLAEQTGAKVTLLYVLEPPRFLPIGPLDGFIATGTMPGKEEIDQVHQMLQKVAADLPKAQVEEMVQVGRPDHVIVEQAKALGVDLIVVGARGLSAGGRFLVGSISDRVVHEAGIPVTVVH